MARKTTNCTKKRCARDHQLAVEVYKAKEEVVGAQVLRNFEKSVMLQTLDTLWKEHLAAMDHLRQGIHLRGYAQRTRNKSTNVNRLNCLKVYLKR